MRQDEMKKVLEMGEVPVRLHGYKAKLTVPSMMSTGNCRVREGTKAEILPM